MIDINDCYKNQQDLPLATLLTWEHVVQASLFGSTFLEWTVGSEKCTQGEKPFRGRHCARSNPEFAKMEADLYNLWPESAELNGIRNDLKMGDLPGPGQFGPCLAKLNETTFEPPDAAKGIVARVYLYMANAYPKRVKLTSREWTQFKEWDKQFPVESWECDRAKLIHQIQGNKNLILAKRCENLTQPIKAPKASKLKSSLSGTALTNDGSTQLKQKAPTIAALRSSEFNCKHPNCARVFKTKKQLGQHQRDFVHVRKASATMKAGLPAKIVVKTLQSGGNLKDSVDERSDLECNEVGCLRKFSSQMALSQHLKSGHRKRIGCEECAEIFRSQNAQKQHVKEAHSQKETKTQIVFSKTLPIKEKVPTEKPKGASKPEKASCSEEGCFVAHPKLYSQKHLRYHIATAHDKQRIRCPKLICPEKFENVEALIVHVKDAHPRENIPWPEVEALIEPKIEPEDNQGDKSSRKTLTECMPKKSLTEDTINTTFKRVKLIFKSISNNVLGD